MLRVFEAHTQEGSEWLLSDDPDAVSEFVRTNGWAVIAEHDPAVIIASQYQGIGVLQRRCCAVERLLPSAQKNSQKYQQPRRLRTAFLRQPTHQEHTNDLGRHLDVPA